MRTAAISKLKATLSEFLGYVKAGEEILVTDRGKPIARIVPVGDMPHDARRMDLIRRGIIRPGKGPLKPEDWRDLPLVQIPDEVIQRIIDEEREDRA